MIAYCWANGQIDFGPSPHAMPEGAIRIARGTARTVRQEIEAAARHGYEAGVLLVPGIPEAADQQQAGDALELFLLWLKRSERKGFHVAIKPRNPFDYNMCGTPVSSVTVDDRCRAVANFDKAGCLAALLVPNLQITVRTAIDRRLRALLKAEVVA